MAMLRLFGSLAWEREGSSPRPPSRRAAEVLGWLALRGGASVEREMLSSTLWPDSSPEQAGVNLRRTLSDLRGWLGPDAARLESPTKQTLRLELTQLSVDVRLLEEASRSGDRAAALAALENYTGPLLEGSSFVWLVGERERLATLALGLALNLGRDAFRRGNLAEALLLARRAESIDPFSDSAQSLLYEALHLSSDSGAAQIAFRAFRARLHRELNLSVSDELTTLVRRLSLPPKAGERRTAALASLARFTPDFLPEAARAVCGLNLAQLGELAESGELIPGPRWRLAHSIESEPPDETFRARFVRYYSTRGHWLETMIWSDAYDEALATGRAEEDNLLQALEWATSEEEFGYILRGLLNLWNWIADPQALEMLALVVLTRMLNAPPLSLSESMQRGIRGWRLTFWSRLGRNEEARLEAETLLALAQGRGDLAAQIHLSLPLGAIYQELGEWGRARERLEAMLSLCRSEKDDGWTIDALGALVGVYTHLKEMQKALDCSNEELALSQSLAIEAGVLEALWHRGRLLEALLRQDDAELIWEELRERAERASDARTTEMALEGLARVAEAQGRSAAATRYHERATALRGKS